MNWHSFVARLRHRRVFDRWALEIAQRSQDLVWDRVQLRAVEMCASEARGYIRARSLPIVQRTMAAIAAVESAISDLDRHALLLAASDHVASLILRNLPKVSTRRQPIRKAA